ncbi:pseudouridine synthase [Microbacterium elymi]|uniref:RNA pseudouridylate synthase n=1 Tax=Microbacterium elymi TaxID=2909587 RepID=A0ABY5NJ33_9MICO|nr:pseudouridine synthase [Microbacterium elymi]UUT35153.1 pseudouridine synthase [Microbacterium elymi]
MPRGRALRIGTEIRAGCRKPTTMGGWLRERFGARVDVSALLAELRFVYESGSPVRGDDPYRSNTFVWFHRDLPDEAVVPGRIRIVYRDERIVVVDKPPFLSTIPRGQHVRQSVVVRMRDELELPELSPLHRLDRVTSGLVLLATEKRWRGPYQSLFERREVGKVYRAMAAHRPDLPLPVTVRNHLVKHRGRMQAEVVPDAAPNAESLVERESILADGAVYRLTPHTGRTHQLRVHMLGLGIPIFGDPLYPTVQDVPVHDFRTPLELLADELSFVDPVDGRPRRFRSTRTLPLASEVAES